MVKKFLAEFGRRTDWRPKNEQELYRLTRMVWGLLGLVAGLLIGSIITEIVLSL